VGSGLLLRGHAEQGRGGEGSADDTRPNGSTRKSGQEDPAGEEKADWASGPTAGQGLNRGRDLVETHFPLFCRLGG